MFAERKRDREFEMGREKRGGTGTQREGDGDREAILSFREEPPRWGPLPVP